MALKSHMAGLQFWVKDDTQDVRLYIKTTGFVEENGQQVEGKVLRNLSGNPNYEEGRSYWFGLLKLKA